MAETRKEKEDLERAKTVMGKYDPALISAALSEMMMEADEAEGNDVANAKKAIKEIYDSIPKGKDKASIMSKAIAELDTDVIKSEIKAIKESLADIERETMMEAAKDYDIGDAFQCLFYTVGCDYKIFDCLKRCIRYAVYDPGPCLRYGICAICVRYAVNRCQHGCPLFRIYQCGSSVGVDIPPEWERIWEWEVGPLMIKEQLKAEIIQEVLQRPELSRAMKKMLKEIRDEK